MEGSVGRENSPPQCNLNGVTKGLIGRQDSTGSQDGSRSSYSFRNSSRSNNLSFFSRVSSSGNHFHKQREDFVQDSNAAATLLLQNSSSSKDHMDAAEVTIDLLQAEAWMWEQNSQKLMINLEILQKELSNRSKHQASLEV